MIYRVALMNTHVRPLLILICVALGTHSPSGAELRVGMIGLDTSHVIAFTQILNDPTHKDYVPGAKVVAGFKGGSPDIEASASRVEGFTQQLTQKFGVKIYDSIEELCQNVDAVMLESVDGRPHLEQARPVFAARKPMYIDKPLAGTLRDALAIAALAKETATPCFSSSSYRFYPGIIELKQADAGEVRGAISYGPCSIEPHHPDLFWYGVHGVEALFTVMGQGCQQVTRTTSANTDEVVGLWPGGRIGTFRGLRGGVTPSKVILFGSKAVLEQKPGGGYGPLVREIVKFFQTGKPPVSMEETIEMFAFMEAADESKRRGGTPVTLAEVVRKAQ